MKVKAKRSFVARIDGQTYRVAAGDIITMPSNADWLTAGLVIEAENSAETAAIEPTETAAKPKPTRRKRKATSK